MSTPPSILLETVEKRYPQHLALSGVSLEVPSGVCLALLGHNGAGKTTLMKLILGLTRPTAGKVQVLGCDPLTSGLAFRRQIGFLAENVSFHEQLTGRDTLRFYARLKGEPPRVADPLLERVGLANASRRRVKTYSKGMRQRLGLAQALLGEPRLLLLDEPTTGLDPVLRQEFFRIILELRSGGTTVLLSSHILTELEARTDRVAILCQGQRVAYGTLEELRQQANMPLLFRLVITPGQAGTVSEQLGSLAITPIGLETWELACPVIEKMAVLRKIMAIGPVVENIEIKPPTLDDVYIYFSSVS